MFRTLGPTTLHTAVAITLAAGLPFAAHAQCAGVIIDPEQGHAFVLDPSQESVNAVTRWDPDGDGPEPEWLVVAGQFRRAATQISQSIVAWDGVRWRSLDAGLAPAPGPVTTLASIIDLEVLNGTLVAYGTGLGTGASVVIKWNGASWERLGDHAVIGPVTRSVIDMEVHNAELYVAGATGYVTIPFNTTPASPVIRRVGETWQTIGPPLFGNGSRVSRLESAPEGLYGAGTFTGVGTTGSQVVLNNVGLWNGTQWLPLGQGLNGPVRDTAYFNNSLYVIGTFTQSGTTPLPGIARWDGTQWSPVGDGSHGTATTIESHQGSIFITASSGGTTRTLRLDGTSWTEVARPGQAPPGISANAAISALVSDPDGLLILGRFSAVSGFEAGGAAVITPDGSLRTLGAGFATRTSMFTLNGELFAQTSRRAGDEPVNFFARWNGREWSNASIPVQPQGQIVSTDQRLFAISVGNNSSNVVTIRELDDGQWQSLPGPFEFPATIGKSIALVEYANDLYAAGPFTSVNGVPIKGLARLDGTQWTQVGQGLDNTAFGSASIFGESSFAIIGNDLYIAGDFDRVGNLPASNLARWDGNTLTPLQDPAVIASRSIVNLNGSVVGIISITTPEGRASRVAQWNGTRWDVLASIPAPEGPVGSIRRLLPAGSSLWALYEDYPNKSYLLRLNPDGTWSRASGTFQLQPAIGFNNQYLADALVFNNEVHIFGSFNREGDNVAVNWARFTTDGVPLIVTQPADVTASCGDPVRLRAIVANGYETRGDLEYQWFRNGVALSETQFVRGVNTDTLSIPALSQPFTGLYTLTVTNACGTATTREVFVTGDSLDCRACAPCPADFDLDGGVTASDVASFFASFETGNACADVDADGSITGTDLAAFFAVFEAGGC